MNPGSSAIGGAASAGSMQRYPASPEKVGGLGVVTAPRTTEWMPSAPITTSAVIVSPSSKVTCTSSPVSSTAAQRLPTWTIPSGSTPSRASSSPARWAT